MPKQILLLTPGLATDEAAAIARQVVDTFGDAATVQTYDPSTEDGRGPAREALASGRVDLVLSSQVRYDLYVLPEAKAPIVMVAREADQLGRAAEGVGSLRLQGCRVALAATWDEAMVAARSLLWPPVLAGKRALIFADPFDSGTVPRPHLTVDYVRAATGVELEFRPLEALADAYVSVDEARAAVEMEAWLKGAGGRPEPSQETLLDASRLYVALRDLVERERLDGVSADCVRYIRGGVPKLPHPCLAFSRLRDQGVAAPCEADACALVSELLVEGVAQRPAFMANVGAIDPAESTVELLHCLVPLQMEGYDAEPCEYGLHHYHETGEGVAMAVGFPLGREVTLGAYWKDFRTFALWPGTIVATGSSSCRSSAVVRVPDVQRFVSSMGGIHWMMVLGDQVAELADVLTRMNVTVLGPIASGRRS